MENKKLLNELIEELEAINGTSYYNMRELRSQIILGGVLHCKRDGEGNVITGNEHYELLKKNPYCVEILGTKDLLFIDNKTKQKVQRNLTILKVYRPTLEEAIEDALGKLDVMKGNYSNKKYAEELYQKSVKRGYIESFDEWVKDVEEFNNDRITGAYIIEKPLYDENDKRITNGVYKRYPRGINKTQDMIDDKEVNKS
jgi:hypothetical protein